MYKRLQNRLFYKVLLVGQALMHIKYQAESSRIIYVNNKQKKQV